MRVQSKQLLTELCAKSFILWAYNDLARHKAQPAAVASLDLLIDLNSYLLLRLPA